MRFDVVSPILGFEDISVMELEKIDDVFMKLKSKEGKKNTSFTLINPFVLREYEIEIPKYYKDLLEIRDKNSSLILNAMIVKKPIEESEINFIAPFIFNPKSKKMAQVVLDSNKYPHLGIMQKLSDFMTDTK